MRVLMMGTGPFALPTLRALIASRHEVAALVTQPRRPSRGRRKAVESPVRALAEQQNLPIFDPPNINTPESRETLSRYDAELFVVADYGQILRAETLGVAPRGAINLHASLLPRYRGAAPVNWALYHGEAETGVTVFQLTPQVDAGPIFVQQTVAIEPGERAGQLETRLAEIGAPRVVETVDAIEAGRAKPLAQPAAQASRAPRLKKHDGEVDWSRPAHCIVDQIRAMDPWPGTFTFWHRQQAPPLRLGLHRASVVSGEAASAPGTILQAEGDRLVVATGEQALLLESVQPSGKRRLGVAEFLRGYPLRPGQRLGPEVGGQAAAST